MNKSIQFGNENLKLKLDTIQLPCYILDNGMRVFTKDGIQKSMGYHGKSENWLYEFLLYLSRLTMLDPDLLETLEHDILFNQAIGNKTVVKNGIAATDFIKACQAISKANKEGFLYLSELKFAKAADTILENTTGKDIKKLIDFATGFELYKQNHIDALYRYMKNSFSENCYLWVKTFPDGFYEQIFDVEEWNWSDLNANATVVAAYLNDIIFSRIAPDLFAELENTKPRMSYRKTNTLEQYIGNPKLNDLLEVLSGLLEASDHSHSIFMRLLERTLPKQRTITSQHKEVGAKRPAEDSKLSQFNENLRKTLGQAK